MQEPKPPKNTSLRQQRLSAFKPIHTARSSAVIFFVSSGLFFLFGGLLYSFSTAQQEYSIRYDNICPLSSSCTFPLHISKEMPAPVFLYYELHNFYQNHRLYVKSKSYKQLRGDSPSSSDLAFCSPAKYNKDFKGYYRNKTLSAYDTARPCGLIARSVFNDSISLTNYSISLTSIVKSVDEKMYVSLDSAKEWTKIDEHFINWMKIAPLSEFRKLYGVIESSVKGNVTVKVNNNYNVKGWDGKKTIVLATAGKFGGKNLAASIVFLVSGVVCFVCFIVFFAAMLIMRQKWMDEDPKSWRFK